MTMFVRFLSALFFATISSTVKGQDCSGVVPVMTDVVVIGAGVSGVKAYARLKEVAPELDVTVLESTRRTGGRVRTYKGFGSDNMTIEEGANWIYTTDNNVIFELTNEYGLRNLPTEDSYIPTYEYDADSDTPPVQVPASMVNQAFTTFRQGPFEAALRRRDRLWDETKSNVKSAVQLMKNRGYDETDPLQYAAKWNYIDFEFASADTSLLQVFDPYAESAFFVSDVNGFETVIQRYADENGVSPIYDQRVKKIIYNLNDGNIRARVVAEDSEGKCSVYDAKRVISTVSTGVLNNNLIEFEPPLAYPAPENNPFEFDLYIKVFIEFENAFWDKTEYFFTLKQGNNDGVCMQWINVNHSQPGSNTLICTLLTEQFDKVVGGSENRYTASLAEQNLSDMLEPLRRSYPDTYEDPISFYYPPLNKDADFGFGAYGDWKVGKTPYDYFRFYGGGKDNYYLRVLENDINPNDSTPKEYNGCFHNGCNNAGEWILYMSGTASCSEYWEMVHGGYYAGEAAASYALQSLGFELESDWYDKCYYGNRAKPSGNKCKKTGKICKNNTDCCGIRKCKENDSGEKTCTKKNGELRKGKKKGGE